MTRGVGILGISGYEADGARLDQATRYFESHGCRVRVLPAPAASTERFAGSDAVRLEALAALANDPAIEIVIGLRGGYGLSRLLGAIDFPALAQGISARRQKWVGHSDFTALQLALLARSGAGSLAGPMAGPDFGNRAVDPFTEEQFWRACAGERLDLEWPCGASAGAVRGVLWGGSLSMVCSLIGTPYLPAIDNGLLFLEDTNEQPYRIERMLLQLEMAGILGRQRAVLMGDFDGIRVHPYDRGFDLSRVVAYLAGRIGIPVVTGLPFGHGARKATLPVGAVCELVLDGARAHLRSSAATA